MNILNMPIQDMVNLVKECFAQTELFKEIELLDSEVDETLLKQPYLVFNFDFECELPELPEMELIEPQCKTICEEIAKPTIPAPVMEFLDSKVGIFDNMNFISKVIVR